MREHDGGGHAPLPPLTERIDRGAAVVPAEDGTLRLRVWPRRWSEKKKAFTQDTDNTPQDRPYAEHTLPGLRLAARATFVESP